MASMENRTMSIININKDTQILRFEEGWSGNIRAYKDMMYRSLKRLGYTVNMAGQIFSPEEMKAIKEDHIRADIME